MARSVLVLLLFAIYVVRGDLITPAHAERVFVSDQEQTLHERKQEIREELEKYYYDECNQKLVMELEPYFKHFDQDREEDQLILKSMFLGMIIAPTSDEKILNALISRIASWRGSDLIDRLEFYDSLVKDCFEVWREKFVEKYGTPESLADPNKIRYLRQMARESLEKTKQKNR